MTGGKKLDSDKISQIKKGVTTRSEVIALLGKPNNSMVVRPDRPPVLIYQYWETTGVIGQVFSGGLVNNDTRRMQILAIHFDKSNVVEDYTFSDDTTTSNRNVITGKGNTTTAPTETEKKK